MSKSIRRNYRVRDDDSDDDNNILETQNDVTSTSSKTSIQATTVLSFGDEFDEDDSTSKNTFALKKESRHKEKRRNKQKEEVEKDGIEIYLKDSLKKGKNRIKIETSEISIKERRREITSRINKGDIPTSDAIDKLKKQRELAAKQQHPTNEISVPSEEIRTMSLNLVFDEDEDYHRSRKTVSTSSNRTNNRIKMVGHVDQSEKEREIMRNNFISVEHGLHDDDSDHDNEWESRQMKNAINKSVVMQKEVDNTIKWHKDDDENNNDEDSMILNELNTMKYEDISIEKLRGLLHQRKEEVIKKQDDTKEEIESNVKLISDTEKKADEAELDIPVLELKYNTFNNLQRYIQILSSCFNDKMENIIYLENKYLRFYHERSNKLLKRTRQDVKDQFEDLLISTKSPSEVVQSTNDAIQRSARISDRESRRLRRLKARESSSSMLAYYEGLSSDDEEPKSVVSSRQMEIDHIKSETERLFADADQDYCVIEHILEKFTSVQAKFEEDYNDAYISRSLAHVISPLIRLELVTWNPLISPRFDKWNWFKTLVEFTKEQIGTEPIVSHSGIKFGYLKLIPSIMEKVVVPRITEWISVWNPMSAKETISLVSIVSKLISQFPTINDKSSSVKNLMRSIASRINDCIAEDITIPLYIEEYKSNPSGPGFQFFLHQMWSIIKTFCNIMMLNEILETKLLCKLALEGILNNYILTSLNVLLQLELPTYISVIIRHIRQSFPQSWFENHQDLASEVEKIVNFIARFVDKYRKDKNAMECVTSFLEHINLPKFELNQILKVEK